MTRRVPYQPLLDRVADRLATASTATDHLLLTRWRVLGLCQYLLGTPSGEAERLSVQALELYARKGPGERTDKALRQAVTAVANAPASTTGSILPAISPAKRDEVLARLGEYEALGKTVVQKAVEVLPALRDRLRQSPTGALLAGVRHRLELVATIAADEGRLEADRCRAAAAVLYLDEVYDAIPDSLGYIGLLDDDFALRVVLEECGGYTEEERLHWAERISALWDDLPFLRGVRLRRDKGPVATTWLDRISSYVSYTHALNGDEKPLILVQPSVACSPLHSIVSLIGLLVLDGLTSSQSLTKSLREGEFYEIDGKFYARFEGVSSGPPAPGWLRLRFRDVVIYRPPTLADRMVRVPERGLSSGKAFSVSVQSDDAEPIQRFFDWQEAIGAASITARVLLVTSRQRAVELFDGVRSNEVALLDDGLVRFAGMSPRRDVLQGGLVLVVPTLSVARQLVEQGVEVHAIVVDGYERLHRGRYDLPFVLMRPSPPAVIVWSVGGYCPSEAPSWLPEHRRLEVGPDDLSYILELDGDGDRSEVPSRASLQVAASGPSFEKVVAPFTPGELTLLEATSDFIQTVRSSSLPEYWKYHLFSSATMLRTLVAATPACWCDISAFVRAWTDAFDEQWQELSPRAAEALADVALSHREVVSALEAAATGEWNSKASTLMSFLDTHNHDDWRVVCDRSEQVKVVGRLLKRSGASGLEPVLLRDLGVCHDCIVVGWRSYAFARRLLAHTPRHVVALVDEDEGWRWDRLLAHVRERHGDSLLEAVGQRPPPYKQRPERRKEEPPEDEPTWRQEAHVGDHGDEPRVPCVFVWLADEPEGRVLARDSRVLVEDGDQAREKPAYRIVPEDRVILGPGSSRWSPADEFTQAVVEAIEASQPALVNDVKEWRRALRKAQEAKGWSAEELRSRLVDVGVRREVQTIEGWLKLERAAPIGPRRLRAELRAIWVLVGPYSERTAEQVITACSTLRSLRSAAGRVLLRLWKGRSVDLGVDNEWLEELVDQLRQEVRVHEVEAVTYGVVPKAMLGWWVPTDLAAAFESESQEERRVE